ncbi:MAG: glycosyltransferase [Myxococcota bacterium]
MKVLHVTRDFPPRAAGGLSVAVAGLVAAAAARGVAQAVVSFDGWRPAGARPPRTSLGEVGGVRVLRVEDALDERALAAFAAELDPDVVQIHDGALAALTPRATVGPRATRVQMVHVLSHLQDALRRSEPTGTTLALDEAVRTADRVVVATHAAAAAARERWPAAAERLSVAGLAPGLQTHARAADAERGPMVAALRFDWLKGVDLLVAATPALTRARPVIVAGGLPESPKSERRWARRLEAAGATWVGWVGPDTMAELLARAALVIAPSRLETCGLALLEAAQAGVPTVASDIAAHREIVPDAAFFASGDAAALVATATALLAAPRAPRPAPGWDAKAEEWLAFWRACRG